MKPLIAKMTPAGGFSNIAHMGINVLLPFIVFVLVRIDFVPLALAVIVLSKWRMFVVRPRFWPANIRANSVDIIVNVAFLVFMVHSGSILVQFWWVIAYAAWLVIIKPASSTFMVSLQAMVGLLFGLSALFIGLGDGALYWLVLLSGLICYLSARHFFDSFDEPYAKMLSYVCGYFGAGLVWVLGHWLLFYASGLIAQPTLLLVALGYGTAALYYLEHHDRLSRAVQGEIMATTAVIVLAIVISLTVNVMTTVRDLLQ